MTGDGGTGGQRSEEDSGEIKSESAAALKTRRGGGSGNRHLRHAM